MATNFPTSLQDLDATRGSATDKLNSPSHVTHHLTEDDTLEALQTKVGIDSSAVTTSHDYLLRNLPGQAANWDAGTVKITAATIESDIGTGSAPLIVASTTVVSNLNADRVDGYHASDLTLTAAFVDNETPTGAINSSNKTFTLANTPSPAASLQLFLSGIYQTAGGEDYTLVTATITFVNAPTIGPLKAFYRK